MKPEILQLLEHMDKAILAAGAAIIRMISDPKGIQVWRKPDNTVVMNIDLESQRVLSTALKTYLPVASEESIESHEIIGKPNDYFVIDPLDGTSSCRRFLDVRGGQVGFGPLVGLVRAGRLEAASFFHMPRRTLFSAYNAGGCYLLNMSAIAPERFPLLDLPPLVSRERLALIKQLGLSESALLFYPGTQGELQFVEWLRRETELENTYRFGGFANDCTRLASGFEQAQVQSAVKAWDFSAVLFPAEAGLKVTVEPVAKSVELAKWTVAISNPVLVSQLQIHDFLLTGYNKVLKG